MLTINKDMTFKNSKDIEFRLLKNDSRLNYYTHIIYNFQGSDECCSNSGFNITNENDELYSRSIKKITLSIIDKKYKIANAHSLSRLLQDYQTTGLNIVEVPC